MNAIDLIRSALDDLPDTPNAIAEKLQAQGIRAALTCPDSCAIAEYLQGRLMSAGFDGETIKVLRSNVMVDNGELRPPLVRMPTAVHLFIFHFDEGDYPHLVDVAKSRASKSLSWPARDAKLDEIEQRQKGQS